VSEQNKTKKKNVEVKKLTLIYPFDILKIE